MIRYRNELLVAITSAVLLIALPHGVSAQTPQATPTSSVKAAADSVAESNGKDVLRAVEQVRDDVRALRHEVETLRALLETARGKSGSNAVSEGIALAAAGPKEPLLKNGVYFFHAVWSGPCQRMRPFVDRLKREGLPIVDVDVDRRRDLRDEFHIDTIPVSVLMIGGKEKRRSSGLLTEAQLGRVFKELPNSPSSSATSTTTPKAGSNAKAEPNTKPTSDAPSSLAAMTGHDPPRNTRVLSDKTDHYEPRAYPVADLVVSIPGKRKSNTDENFEMLKRLVTDTIEPASWQSRGGAGSIQQYDKTLSLIVRQTPAVHRQLRAFLLSLRALQEWQVCVESIVVENIPAGVLESLGLPNPLPGNHHVLSLTEEQRTKLLAASQQDPAMRLYLPKVTMFYGQSGSIAPVANRNEALDLEISDSTDRYAVNLRLGLHDNKTGKATIEPVTVNVPNLNTVIIEMKRIGEAPSARRPLLLVRPRILFPIEEEK
jgi:thiol-disulfide isomerase/thioredoxin